MKKALKILFLGLTIAGVESQAQTVTGTVSGYDYVDLGLASKKLWATYNVGATKTTEYGSYYAWGETTQKKDYSWKTYKWCKGSQYNHTKYCTDSSFGTVDKKTTLEAADDVAIMDWGDNWRMPTISELKEMRDGCKWVWTEDFEGSGAKGYVGTSKTNGNTIFLPASNCREYEDPAYPGGGGFYWSSSLYGDSFTAYCLEFYDGFIGVRSDNRCYGYSIRPIVAKKITAVSNISNLSLQIHNENGFIYIGNAEAYTKIQLFDMSGKIISTTVTDSNGNASINVSNKKGIYVVTVGVQSTKIILK